MELVRKGLSQREISCTLGVDRRTVRRWTRARGFPERKQVRRKNAIDQHRPYLDQRWNEGCHNAAQLWREIRDLGFSGTSSSVRQWVLKHFGRKIRSHREPLPPKSGKRASLLALPPLRTGHDSFPSSGSSHV
jgi:transposase